MTLDSILMLAGIREGLDAARDRQRQARKPLADNLSAAGERRYPENNVMRSATLDSGLRRNDGV